MTDLKALLDQIDRLDQEATPEPWVHDDDDTSLNMDSIVSTALGDLRWIEVARSINHDTEFIALARTALPQLAKALHAVMEIHKPFHADHYYNGMDGESLHRFVLRCDGCEESGGIEDYPCPTVQAITDAMNEADDD